MKLIVITVIPLILGKPIIRVLIPVSQICRAVPELVIKRQSGT
jgi:hypothetical protein